VPGQSGAPVRERQDGATQRQAISFGARSAAGEGRRGGELAAVAGWREEGAEDWRRAQSLPRQPLAESKNLSREYGGQWLSSTTRHIRIYAASIDPAGDQRLRPDAEWTS
jgi:hypothetical protein